jgi:hypothetical protein
MHQISLWTGNDFDSHASIEVYASARGELNRYDTTFLFLSLGLVERRNYIDAEVNPSRRAI